jgi:hypothetical protein
MELEEEQERERAASAAAVHDESHPHDNHSIAPTDTNTGYASTVVSRVDGDGNVTELSFERESLHPSKTPYQEAIAEAAVARSRLTKKEAQKLDDKLSSLICGKVPRMTVTGVVPKLQKGTGFLVGSPDEIATALAAGADVHLGCGEGSKTNQDALWYEIANKKRAEVADLLLQYGARLDATKLIGCSYYGANRDILTVLLEYGADPNGWAHLGVGPLCTASQYGNPHGARLLMAYGADPNAMNIRSQKGTALATASYKLNVDTVRMLLLYGADPNTEGYDHLSPARAAIENVKRMSQANSNNGRDRMLPILQYLKKAGSKEPEIDIYLDPYSEATKSLIHPWDYNKHLKRLRMGAGQQVARSNGQNGQAAGRFGRQDSTVESEFGGSTRALLVK